MNSPAVLPARNKMQKVLQFTSEHRQRIFRITYISLVLPILILTSMLLCSPGSSGMAREH